MPKALVKENPARILIDDADAARLQAVNSHGADNLDWEARYSRISTLLYCAELEASINFVYRYAEVPHRRWKSLNLAEKWIHASTMCMPFFGIVHGHGDTVLYTPGDAVETFDRNTEPFTRFLELKDLRDHFLHLKAPFAVIDWADFEAHAARVERYPLTGLPLRLQSFRAEHARTAHEIFEAMTIALERYMHGMVMRGLREHTLIEFNEDDLLKGGAGT